MGFTVHVQKQARKGKKKIGYWKVSVNYIILLWSEDIQTGPAQQNLGSKTKILYGDFLYVNIN